MKLLVENITVELTGKFSGEMSDEEFFNFCEQNSHLRIERDAYKQIYIMAPVNSLGGSQNFSIALSLGKWNEKNSAGICFDSSTGFTLPDGSVFSPDASWMPIEKWNSLPKAEQMKFAAVCPDFIIELKSSSDNIKGLKLKMQNWIENGVRLAWLINADAQQTFIYKADGSVTIIEGFDQRLSGEDVLPDFEFDLSILK
jgi:Uma2 family endonuclease